MFYRDLIHKTLKNTNPFRKFELFSLRQLVISSKALMASGLDGRDFMKFTQVGEILAPKYMSLVLIHINCLSWVRWPEKSEEFAFVLLKNHLEKHGRDIRCHRNLTFSNSEHYSK